MKELSIEEKAKRYDEAIEKLRSLHDDYDTISTLIDIKEELEHVFPELKESEDEKIRKALLTGLIDCRDGLWLSNFGGIPIDDCIAWLEKQGEHKPTWNEEDEEMLNYALDMVEWYGGKGENKSRIVSDWLKSLKDGVYPQWKPSEEQIQALEYQVHSTYKGSWQYKASNELLEQLKKL